MGNCLIVLENAVRIMKKDRKFLEYNRRIEANQMSSEFSQNEISAGVSDVKYLLHHPEEELHLLPSRVPPLPPVKKIKKKVQFSNEGIEDSRVVRIKLVITRQELRAMIGKGGISVDHNIPELQKEDNRYDDGGNGKGKAAAIPKGWSPALESIPEVI